MTPGPISTPPSQPQYADSPEIHLFKDRQHSVMPVLDGPAAGDIALGFYDARILTKGIKGSPPQHTFTVECPDNHVRYQVKGTIIGVQRISQFAEWTEPGCLWDLTGVLGYAEYDHGNCTIRQFQIRGYRAGGTRQGFFRYSNQPTVPMLRRGWALQAPQNFYSLSAGRQEVDVELYNISNHRWSKDKLEIHKDLGFHRGCQRFRATLIIDNQESIFVTGDTDIGHNSHFLMEGS